MNPSARELAEAIQGTGARDVILLPNNSNVILTARQASEISQLTVHCISTTTLPQGVSALLAYSSDLPVSQVLEAMERSTAEVKTLEVTTAVKDAVISRVPVERGQIMGLLDGKLVSCGTSPLAVLKEGLTQANPPEGGVVTLYWGGDVGEPEARAAAADIEALFPGLEVEVVHGGQPYYHYIASVE
jgi:dihydroxyacetone kinase-like predicted kinase